jgi:hypothetical protein
MLSYKRENFSDKAHENDEELKDEISKVEKFSATFSHILPVNF